MIIPSVNHCTTQQANHDDGSASLSQKRSRALPRLSLIDQDTSRSPATLHATKPLSGHMTTPQRPRPSTITLPPAHHRENKGSYSIYSHEPDSPWRNIFPARTKPASPNAVVKLLSKLHLKRKETDPLVLPEGSTTRPWWTKKEKLALEEALRKSSASPVPKLEDRPRERKFQSLRRGRTVSLDEGVSYAGACQSLGSWAEKTWSSLRGR